MYPGTIFNWFDESGISETNEIIELQNNSPLFMVVGSFDKGPEDLREIYGEDFNALYGDNMSFERHGQNAIQAQRIINAGGKLLIKRVCADDSTLANLVLVATVTSDISGCSIKWEAKSIAGCKTFDEVKKKALELRSEDEMSNTFSYPVLVITDNGRGVSGKAIRLIPDYNTSKTIGKMFYSLAVFEGSTNKESVAVTIEPTVIYSGTAYGIYKDTMTQITAEIIDTEFDDYVAKVGELSKIDPSALRYCDLIYGYTCKGESITGVSLDANSVDFNTTFGVELKEGTNGVFGSKPILTEALNAKICEVYDGEVTDEVWDVDQHKIAAILDANYSIEVKESIAKFVNFRKDCVFFRDYGTNMDTYLAIKEKYDSMVTRSNFIADYCTYYQVKDPVTKKRITVTMMYDLAECLVKHFLNGAYNPLAGTINNFVLKEAIKGTINFTPINTPTVNQKQAMEELRVNYAIFQEDNCVVQSLYSSQQAYTELSYINNTIAIQAVARAVRTACPKNRYKLVTGSDFSDYASAVNNVLSNFTGYFNTLEFVYTEDKLKASQKIFYASIKFSFNQWAQAEIFDLIAINDEDISTSVEASINTGGGSTVPTDPSIWGSF